MPLFEPPKLVPKALVPLKFWNQEPASTDDASLSVSRAGSERWLVPLVPTWFCVLGTRFQPLVAHQGVDAHDA